MNQCEKSVLALLARIIVIIRTTHGDLQQCSTSRSCTVKKFHLLKIEEILDTRLASQNTSYVFIYGTGIQKDSN